MDRSLRCLASLSIAALLLVASPAAAQRWERSPPPMSPLGGALRLGLEVPSGPMYSGEPLRNQLRTQVSLQGELGTRVTPGLLFGGYLGGGVGEAGPRFSLCGEDCTGWSVHAGFLAHWDLAPFSPLNPWLAYGVGLAVAGISGDGFEQRVDYSYVGLDVARLSGGLELLPSGRGRVGLGLFAEWTLGVYRLYHWAEQDVTLARGSVREPTVHQWFSIGPRLSF